MRVADFPHEGKALTGKLMYHFAEKYCTDLGPARFQGIQSWYDEVRRIPYQSDDEYFPASPKDVVEVVARPKYLLDRTIWPAIDCKKKSILIGAWAAANAVPYCFLAVAEFPNRNIHHVFPMVNLGGEWVTADATFPEYHLGQAFDLTKIEELKR